MKIDRLIGILSVLLQQEMITAPELAEKFEVSEEPSTEILKHSARRGYRSGPCRGVGGGIRIMEGFSMDRTLLTSKDMQMIVAGLRSLDSVRQSLLWTTYGKSKPGSSNLISGRDSILIDLSSWYKEASSRKSH